jgi:hypothetical protein
MFHSLLGVCNNCHFHSGFTVFFFSAYNMVNKLFSSWLGLVRLVFGVTMTMSFTFCGRRPLLACAFHHLPNLAVVVPTHRPRPQVYEYNLSVKSSSSDSSSGEGKVSDPVLKLPLLEAELAIKEECDHPDTETLRATIADIKTTAEFGVRKAQLQFYDAFSKGDYDAMDLVWSTVSHVRCVHPGMQSIEGRKAVMESWKQILATSTATGEDDGAFNIGPERTLVEIHGLVAICSCIEVTSQGTSKLEALNIYKREDGSWRMTLHMAGPVLM